MATKLVTEVISSEFEILKSNAPQLFLKSDGEVPTGGWSNGQLSPLFYFVPPADGLQEFNFTAEEPIGPATQNISTVQARVTIEMPLWLKGYRITTASGKKHEVVF